jgi:prevent-host-death family protein
MSWRALQLRHPQLTIASKSHFVLNGSTSFQRGLKMKTMSAREAKNGFGLLIDTARAEPVLIEKHGRGVVVVISLEQFERLSLRAGSGGSAPEHSSGAKGGTH